MSRSYRLQALLAGTALTVTALLPVPAIAQDWTGATSNNWFTAGNWNPAAVPTAGQDVTINTIAPNPTIINGGTAVSGQLNVGTQNGTTGNLTTQGGGSLTTNGTANVGITGGTGDVTVTGAGSMWTIAGQLGLGTDVVNGGTGRLTVSDGAAVTSASTQIFQRTAPLGASAAIVTGTGSVWNTGALGINGLTTAATNHLTVAAGGTVNSSSSSIAGRVLVTGPGSVWNTGALTVPQGVVTGNIRLTIDNGGVVNSTTASIAGSIQTAITVTDPGSAWNVNSNLEFAQNGLAGFMTIANGGTVNVVGGAGTVLLGKIGLTTPSFFIGNGGAPGTLNAAELVLDGGASVTFIHNSSNYVFAPRISGSGAAVTGTAVTIAGGTTIFTADNTYTGGTTINVGTLQLGNGGSTGAIAGPVAIDSGAALVINRTGNLTLNGTFSGAGSFTQNGNVTTTLGGNGTGFTGATAINGGVMLVNNFFGNSAFTVNAGAALGGNGTVGTTTLAAGATLSPGNSIGTMTVNGNLTFNAGSTYVVEVSPTAADRTNVTGTANLAGTVQAVFLPGAFNSNSYVILSAGTRNGTFDRLTTVGLPSYLTASLDQTSSTTDVLLITVSSNIQLLGTTRNQIAVAGALDAAFNNGQGLFPGFGGLAPDQIPGALNALTGELYPTTAGILLEQSSYMRNAIFGRLRQASSFASGGAMAAFSTGGPQLAYAQDPMQAYAANFPVKAAPGAAAPAPDHTAWATALGSWGKAETDGNAAEAKRDMAGFVAGFDKRFGNWRLGAATGYSASDIRVNAVASKADVETFHLAGYAGGNVGGLNLRFGAAYAYHEITSNRTAAFPGFFDQLRAQYDGYTAQIFGEAGYAISLGRNAAFEPFAGLAAVSTRTDSFAETGSAAALAVAGENISAVYLSLGIRAAANIVLSHDKTLIPRMTLAWQHAFDDVKPSARMAFIGTGAGFTTTGLPIAQDALLLDVGADLAIGRNAAVSLSYVGQIATDAQDHAVKARGTWAF